MSLREILKMILMLTVVTGVCGAALSMVKLATEDQIEYQRLKNIKEPALKKVLTNYDNDPLTDRKTIVIGTDDRGRPIEKTFFLAKKDGKITAVALEAFGGGYEGDIGVMIAIKRPQDRVSSIAITTHTETKGVGTKAMNSPRFMNQFKDKGLDTDFSPEGGNIDAYSGATLSSHGIQKAVEKGTQIYQKVKSKLFG